MTRQLPDNSRLRSSRKFYFLEYFYVLLKSVDMYKLEERVFAHFLVLKQQFQLGESKFKRLATPGMDVSPNQMVRYRYTFQQVLSESEELGLVERVASSSSIRLTALGKEGLDKYEGSERGSLSLNRLLFELMESKYEHVFRNLLELIYGANPTKFGLLILPSYSPYQLGYERSKMQQTGDFLDYFGALRDRLQEDITHHLGRVESLQSPHEELLEKLADAGLLAINSSAERVESQNYYIIVKRGRDFWLNYFLRDLYGFPIFLNAFEMWAYRAKQIGILHITEFYPDTRLQGRIIYPLSILASQVSTNRLVSIYSYPDGVQLYVHNPTWEDLQEEFTQSVFDSYLKLKANTRTNFVSVPSVREMVCYNLKIPEYLFDEYLGLAYRLSFTGKMKLKIALEVDRLPQETNAMFLKRAPIMIEGKYRNIMAIDIAKERRNV